MDPHLPKGSELGKKPPFKVVLFVILGIFLSVGATVYILFATGKIKQPSLSSVFKKEPTVSLNTGSRNPFSKETQYVNPFDPFKSQFYNLKENK